MEWKQEIPTIPGIYLVQRLPSVEIKTFEVFLDDKDQSLSISLVNTLEGRYLRDCKEQYTLWYGPIPLPPKPCDSPSR